MAWHDTHSAHIYLEKHCVFLLTAWALDACRAHEVFFVAHILHFFVIYVPPAHILVRFLFVANIFGVLDLFPGRILRQSVVYAGSDQRLRLSLEFGQISAGIYQCAIQRRGTEGLTKRWRKFWKVRCIGPVLFQWNVIIVPDHETWLRSVHWLVTTGLMMLSLLLLST